MGITGRAPEINVGVTRADDDQNIPSEDIVTVTIVDSAGDYSSIGLSVRSAHELADALRAAADKVQEK